MEVGPDHAERRTADGRCGEQPPLRTGLGEVGQRDCSPQTRPVLVVAAVALVAAAVLLLLLLLPDLIEIVGWLCASWPAPIAYNRTNEKRKRKIKTTGKKMN